MAELDLDAIKARLAAATPGPWWLEYENCGCEYCPHAPYPYAINGPDTTHTMGELSEDYRERYGRQATEISALRDEDANLIAHAPADLAALVAEVERLRVRVDEFEGLDDALIRLRTQLAEKDRELALLRVMKAPAATPAEVVYATHTDMSKPPYRKEQP